MTEKQEQILSIIIGAFIVAGFFIQVYEVGKLSRKIDKVVKYVDITEEELLDEISAYSSSLSGCQGDREDSERFRDERCTCLSWIRGDEKPSTRKEICEYKPPVDKYGVIYGDLRVYPKGDK